MFDEQPDGNPHDECAFEIHRLQKLNKELTEILWEIINDGIHCDVVPHLHRRAIEILRKEQE